MTDWYEGQKIVCVNNKVSPDHSGNKMWIGTEFIEALVEGQIYVIDKMTLIHFDGLGKKDIAFLLQGVETNYTKNSMPQLDKYGEEFYHFWHGRFQPLDEFETDKSVDISLFQGLLNDVNDGKVRFDDDDEDGQMKPKKQLEFT